VTCFEDFGVSQVVLLSLRRLDSRHSNTDIVFTLHHTYSSFFPHTYAPRDNTRRTSAKNPQTSSAHMPLQPFRPSFSAAYHAGSSRFHLHPSSLPKSDRTSPSAGTRREEKKNAADANAKAESRPLGVVWYRGIDAEGLLLDGGYGGLRRCW
jgi:hypothetical protein